MRVRSALVAEQSRRIGKVVVENTVLQLENTRLTDEIHKVQQHLAELTGGQSLHAVAQEVETRSAATVLNL